MVLVGTCDLLRLGRRRFLFASDHRRTQAGDRPARCRMGRTFLPPDRSGWPRAELRLAARLSVTGSRSETARTKRDGDHHGHGFRRIRVRHADRLSDRPVETVTADVLDDASVASAVNGTSAVINLVGILSERGRQTYRGVHVEGARRIALSAKSAGQRWSITPTRPALSRKAMTFSPRSKSRIGLPSTASSEDKAAGNHYCRIKSPITVPSPTPVKYCRARALRTLAPPPGSSADSRKAMPVLPRGQMRCPHQCVR